VGRHLPVRELRRPVLDLLLSLTRFEVHEAPVLSGFDRPIIDNLV
jgi:hypothetical protein